MIFYGKIAVTRSPLQLLARYFSFIISKVYSVFLVFINLTKMCLDVNLLGFVLFKIHLASWICRFMSFAKFGTFQPIFFFFEYFFSSTLFLLFCWDSDDVTTKSFVMFPQLLEILLNFQSIFSLFSSDWVKFQLFYLTNQWLFPLSPPFCSWVHLFSVWFWLFLLLFFCFIWFLLINYFFVETFFLYH